MKTSKKMEDDLKINKMEDDLKKMKKWKKTSKKKMEDDLKHNFRKSILIGCDIIVN